MSFYGATVFTRASEEAEMVSVEWTGMRPVGMGDGVLRGGGRANDVRRDAGRAVGSRPGLGWRTVAHWVVVGGALGYLAWRIPGMAVQFAQLDHVRWEWLVVAGVSGLGALVAYGELHRQLLLVGGVRLPVATVQGITL